MRGCWYEDGDEGRLRFQAVALVGVSKLLKVRPASLLCLADGADGAEGAEGDDGSDGADRKCIVYG